MAEVEEKTFVHNHMLWVYEHEKGIGGRPVTKVSKTYSVGRPAEGASFFLDGHYDPQGIRPFIDVFIDGYKEGVKDGREAEQSEFRSYLDNKAK